MWSITRNFLIFKSWLFKNKESVLVFFAVFFSVLLVWGLVNFWFQKKTDLLVITPELSEIKAKAPSQVQIVGNKNSKIYHLADCPGALAMSEVNKVLFDSLAAAEAAGFRAAKNCPELEYLR
ncbi:hypothetical protein C4553_01685 [Candidatus Parcubacteria bacterium]|nr:MAG: hypothetical protein C4553_01685 [Candidatus Parcubacteria bacterium]